MPKKMVSKLSRVREAVKILNVHLQNREVATVEYFKGMEAVFELLDQPWDLPAVGGRELAWQAGYEQCMTDIVDALADEWGVVVWDVLREGCLGSEER